MGSSVIVFLNPIHGQGSYFIQFKEYVCIQDLFSVTTVKSFYKTILHRSAWLNKLKGDLPIAAPPFQILRGVLGSVIHSNDLRLTSPIDHLFQGPYYPFGR